MTVSTTALGAASKVFVNGALPAADATGILPHMAGSADFLTYNGATDLTPSTGYTANLATPNGNVTNGATPGVFFSGTNIINSALAGTDGLINANSAVTPNGDLSGLSGTITTNNGTTNLATNTFSGPLHVRAEAR